MPEGDSLHRTARVTPGVVVYRNGGYELLEGDGLDVEIVERIAPQGVTYTPQREEAVATVDRGDAEAAFLLRPTRIEDVWAVARRGEMIASSPSISVTSELAPPPKVGARIVPFSLIT